MFIYLTLTIKAHVACFIMQSPLPPDETIEFADTVSQHNITPPALKNKFTNPLDSLIRSNNVTLTINQYSNAATKVIRYERL